MLEGQDSERRKGKEGIPDQQRHVGQEEGKGLATAVSCIRGMGLVRKGGPNLTALNVRSNII